MWIIYVLCQCFNKYRSYNILYSFVGKYFYSNDYYQILYLYILFVGVVVEIIEKCVEGASVRDICIWGDNLILEETNKVFKKEKEMKKGINA